MALFMADSSTWAAGPDEGCILAATCTNCHETEGGSRGTIPSLAGRDRNYLIQQIRYKKSGARRCNIMHNMAQGYRDEQIGLIADCFAAQKK